MLLRGKNLARHSLIRIKEIHIIRINSKNNFNQVFRILIKFQFNKTNVAVSRLFSKLIITSLRLLKNVTNFASMQRNVETDRRCANNPASALETCRFQLRETVHRSRALRVSSETYFRDIVVLQQRATSKRTQISTG